MVFCRGNRWLTPPDPGEDTGSKRDWWGDGSDIAEAEAYPRTLRRLAPSLGRQEEEVNREEEVLKPLSTGEAASTHWNRMVPGGKEAPWANMEPAASGLPSFTVARDGVWILLGLWQGREGLGRLGFQRVPVLGLSAGALGMLLTVLWFRGWPPAPESLHSEPGPATH